MGTYGGSALESGAHPLHPDPITALSLHVASSSSSSHLSSSETLHSDLSSATSQSLGIIHSRIFPTPYRPEKTIQSTKAPGLRSIAHPPPSRPTRSTLRPSPQQTTTLSDVASSTIFRSCDPIEQAPASTPQPLIDRPSTSSSDARVCPAPVG